MSVIIDFLGEIAKIDGFIASVITGIFTFFVTKYTYHKNIPLDKLEKAYNRVYYPIYSLVNSNECIEKIIEKCEMYIKKYTKYVDRSTLISFQYLIDNMGKRVAKKAYSTFKSNIYSMNSKLRMRLGYLEPNGITIYTYSSPSEQRIIRMAIELLVAYISVIISTYVTNEDIMYFLVAICIIFSTVLFIEIVIVVVIAIGKGIIKLFFTLKKGIGKVGLKIAETYSKNIVRHK